MFVFAHPARQSNGEPLIWASRLSRRKELFGSVPFYSPQRDCRKTPFFENIPAKHFNLPYII